MKTDRKSSYCREESEEYGASLDLLAQTPENIDEHQQHDTIESNESHPHESTELQRSPWILVLAGFYSILATSSWIILCILSFRPVTTNSYKATPNGTNARYYHPLASSYSANEQWYRAARVIQSIAGVLTIPLTSAVCSNAAVVFVQRHGKANKMTMRQLLALSDKRWTDIELCWKTAKNPVRCWKLYFTYFLLMAFALHVLGGLISPLQTLLLSTKSIKVPGSSQITGISELMPKGAESYPIGLVLSSIATVAIRSLPGDEAYSQYLWQSSGTHCTSLNDTSPTYCGSNMTFKTLPKLQDPFIAQLPNGFNTGVLRQYAPRLNSSAQVESLSLSELPAVCNTDRSFHVSYQGTDWAVQACYPLKTYPNSTDGLYPLGQERSLRYDESPWRQTRDRQDVSEELFLGLKLKNQSRTVGPESTRFFEQAWKITASTTSGWFELPNYMNSGKPGALEDKDPTKLLGRDTVDQRTGASGGGAKYEDDIIGHSLESRSLQVGDPGYGNSEIDSILAPGPLLILAYSLFGAKDSFMATCTTALNGATFRNYTGSTNVRYCARNNQPLFSWFYDDEYPYGTIFGDWASRHDFSNDLDFLEFFEWLVLLGSPRDSHSIVKLEKAFNVGLYFALDAWQNCLRWSAGPNYTVPITSDNGVHSSIPEISVASISVISTLLFVFLFLLLWLASYAAFSPRWASSLNGFTMMRIGSAIADRVPLLVTYEEDQVSALDEVPGWIGSTANKESITDCDKETCGWVAELEIGAADQLRARQRYKCYPLKDH
ncbi:unnamed protein product [Penicillium salamii]|nr:unnamed protein product [Penicillium salamii]CAG8000485.1 unnamed protein product [Penicillium salamii]CAG8284114.1 unnamed protein product [Penicillium salamii]